MIFSATLTPSPSVFGPILFTGDLSESMKQAAHIGYRGIELHISDPHSIDIEQLSYLLAKNDLTLTSIGTGLSFADEGLSFASEDAKIQEAAVQRIKDIIDLFADSRPIIIIGTMKGRLSQASSPEIARSRIRESIQDCAAYAAQYDMTLALEAINRYEQDYLNRLEEAAALIESIGAANIKVHADIFHMNIEEKSILGALYTFQELLGHIHFADNNRLSPGSGAIDFKAILAALKNFNYHGDIGIECLPKPDGKTAAVRSFQYLNTLMDQIE